MKKNIRPIIGFIGQGFIGRHYALDFENRGFNVVKYSKEEPHIYNKEKIASCDIVFIAVPTPTTPKGFDDSIVGDALKLIGKGKIAVIKSTILPGTVEKFQKKYPNIFVMHSPEFLREVSAKDDAAKPERNIVGIPKHTPTFKKKAELVLSVLPKAPYVLVCSSREAELIKYAGNCFLFTKVIFVNMLYDLARGLDCDWDTIAHAMVRDPRIGESHMNPVHQSGRGAGGNCFVKDFAAFRSLAEKLLSDPKGIKFLKTMEEKNVDLLLRSRKDMSILRGVYGDGFDK